MNKIGLFIAATIAVGMFALPATMAYFDGQHTFVDGVDVDCEKCHTTIGVEFALNDLGALDGPHNAMDCRDCHVTSAMRKPGEISGWQNNATKGGHASTAVECVDCHIDSASGAPQIGANSLHDITNVSAAHNAWYLNADLNTDTTLKNGANEVCIACHTHTAVTIIWNGTGSNMSYNQNTGVFNNTDIPGIRLNTTLG